MNRSQRILLAGLLPLAAALILFVLPIKSWDSRPLYLAIFATSLLVGYVEILLFDLEDRLRQLGRFFVIGFPVAVFVVALLIATSPKIQTHPAYWYPSPPQVQNDPWEDLMLDLQPLKSPQEYEQRLKKKAETKAKREAEHKEALRKWEETRYLVPAEHSLRLEDPVDKRTALYWLVLLLLVGTIEFRLLSRNKANAK